MNLKEAIINPIFNIISEVAKEQNTSAYLIGGFVRDFLLEREEKKDIDIVTEGDGIALAKAVANKIAPNIKVSIFKTYGTAMFRYKGIDVEFVGARKESYSEESRNPSVEKGTLEDDQKRRDFTINALTISLNEKDFGALLDPFNGVEDLKSRLIKTPLDADITYSDDPLRMIRAIRFANQLGFEIEEESFLAIKRNAERFDILTKERVIDEFNKIMICPEPGIGIKLLYEAELLERFLPELTNLQGIEEVEGQKHKDNFFHTIEVVDNISKTTDKLWLRWAALLHDIGKARTKRFDDKLGWTFHSHEFVGAKMVYHLFKRLKMPLNQNMKYVQKLVQNSSRPIALISDDATDSALRRLLFDMEDDLEDLFLLCKADITTKNDKKQKKYKENFEKVEIKIKEVEEKDKVRNFQPPISGNEIMDMFVIGNGRQIGELKEAVKEAILDGVVHNNAEDAKKFILAKAKELEIKIK